VDAGKLIGGVLVVLLAIGALYYKYGAKDRVGDRYKEEVLAMLHTLPDYSTYEGLYEHLLEAHSKEAFDHHATMEPAGRRRVRVVVDEEGYLDELFLAMAADAEKQGYRKQADQIRSLRPGIGTQSAEPKRRR
jgi:hypothetical protein